ncbi:hypothetical protein [Pseudochryseolinea flava]|uniref:Leucine-rich repeat domain-containing protein n=1 Tax=Pseudochryseolinea flava TaxID=2059302 RepID=A0A364XW37_9BACT|nr:hypothetical protein [Pseudochryseolinea flava]RAV97598.1 hypothetical protein DQQ10_27590 [Pseudochryseolinea flava]
MNNGIEISPYGSLLVYKKGYTAEEVLSIIRQHNLRGLRIFAQLKDDRLPDLDFLSEYNFLEALDITSVDDSSFSFLDKLGNLKHLTVNCPGQNIIDLSKQTELETLTLHWRKGKIFGLEKCNRINSLCLVDYTEEDFKPVASLLNLEDLKVKTALITTCRGLENLTKLKSILLGNCKKLSEIDGLKDLKRLIHLSFDLCPQIRNYTPLRYLINLETLQIVDCKGVSSIRFIENLPALKRILLLGNTDVLDGDLMPARNIKEVFYKHRKHYNATIENKDKDNLVKSNVEKIKGLFK